LDGFKVLLDVARVVFQRQLENFVQSTALYLLQFNQTAGDANWPKPIGKRFMQIAITYFIHTAIKLPSIEKRSPCDLEP
jgi:hypothetical protein